MTIPDYVHDHFARHPGRVRPHLVCADGYRISVQASAGHYCVPRDNAGPYLSVETYCARRPDGSPWRIPGIRMGGNPAAFVPVPLINRIIHRHGGLSE